MLSIQRKKYIKSLHLKKNREEAWEFLVEWAKNLLELFDSDFEIIEVFITNDFYLKYKDNLKNINFSVEDIKDIENISTIESNNAWVAVVRQKENEPLFLEKNEFIVVLDEIKDPWNLWTILRSCDWYWIKKVILSENSVEFYNPKVISSTMWSFTRISVFYVDLETYFRWVNSQIFWAFLDGQNVHNIIFPKEWFIIIWNESRWISENLKNIVNNKITIPKFWQAESLNAGVATSIILDNLRRNK